jgi:hypothetical protein
VCLTTTSAGRDQFRAFVSQRSLIIPLLFPSGVLEFERMASKGVSRGAGNAVFAGALDLFGVETTSGATKGIDLSATNSQRLTMVDAFIDACGGE